MIAARPVGGGGIRFERDPQDKMREPSSGPGGHLNDTVSQMPAPHPVPPIPTPPGIENRPDAPLRSPLPGIIADPDQIRQVYGRGVHVRRFWPFKS